MYFELVNFDEEFDPNRVIKTQNTIIKNKNKADSFAPGSIYCKDIFGSPFGETVIYECDCGESTAKFAEGTIAECCGTLIQRRESVLSRQGWIDFGDYKLIHPLFYFFIEKIIGSANLVNIINSNRKLDVDGHIVDEQEEDKAKTRIKELGIYGIGISTFLENVFEILEVFVNKKNRSIYDFLLKHRDKIAISKFPVISQRLRPAIILENEFRFDKINNLYTRVVAGSNSLNELLEEERSDILVEPIMYSVQCFLNQIHESILDSVGGKHGWFRNNLMSNRANFSSRCVISPAPIGTAIDEIELPYLSAVELLKFHIIRALLPLYNYSYSKAYAAWEQATYCFDQEVYDIMNLIKERQKGGLRVLINRNPTINFGSILNMSVVRIKSDYSDLTMSISNNILSFLGGDFDGDVIAIFLILDDVLKEHFKPFIPKNMMISNNNGRFNPALSLDKDYQLGFYSFLKAV